MRWGEHVLRLICQYVCVVAELESSSPVKDFRPFFVRSVALHNVYNVVPHFYASLVLRMGGIGVQNPELKRWHRIACSDTLCLSVSVTFSILTSCFGQHRVSTLRPGGPLYAQQFNHSSSPNFCLRKPHRQ